MRDSRRLWKGPLYDVFIVDIVVIYFSQHRLQVFDMLFLLSNNAPKSTLESTSSSILYIPRVKATLSASWPVTSS